MPRKQAIAFSFSLSLFAVLAASSALAQSTGPISAATAKSESAKSIAASSCVANCKARGNVKPQSDCAPKWCEPGQCYRSRYEAYCVK